MSTRTQTRNGFFARCRQALRQAKSGKRPARDFRVVEPLEARIAPAAAITVVLTDNRSTAQPGDTIHYTETVTNTGDASALNLQIANLLDSHTTFVPGSLNISPLAFDDNFTAVGNTQLIVNSTGVNPGSNPAVVVTGNLFSNDVEFANDLGAMDSFVLSTFDAASANGGTVAVNADGTFTYTPKVGFSGVDTFTYTIRDDGTDGIAGNADDLTGTGTVRVTINEVVWYVDNTAPAGGTGTSTSPLNSLTPLNGAGGAGDLDGPGHIIHLAASGTSYTGGIQLEANQKLIGAGVPLVAGGFTLKAAGVAPVLTNSGGAGVTLASNNALDGFSIANTSGAGITGTGITGLQMGAMTITNPGTHGINLSGFSGTLSATGVTISSPTNSGIVVSNASSGATLGFGNVTVTGAGVAGGAIGNGIDLSNSASATFNFSSLNLSTDQGTGLLSKTVGTLNISGSGNVINATGGAAIDLTSTGLGLGTTTFSNASSTNSTGTGINLDTVTGSLTISAGAISTAAGNDIDINAGTVAFNYAGTINNTAAHSVEITGHNTGDITLSGNITDSGTGILVSGNTSGTITFSGASKTLNTGSNPAVTLQNNTGATIDFTGGGLAITTSGAAGFKATGGGTITVQGNNNTITSPNATALEITSTTIGASGVTFRSISSVGGSTSGVILNTTGSLGGLTVTGDGGGTNNGSGGTISSKSGTGPDGAGVDGIYLSNTVKVKLGYMNISGNNSSGIFGTSVNGFVLNRSNVTSNANQADIDEAGVHLLELSGTAIGGSNPTAITNSTISNSHEFDLYVRNTSGTLTDFQVTGTTINNNGGSHQAGNLLTFLGAGSANMKLMVTGSSFTGSTTTGQLTANAIFADTAGGSMNVNVSSSSFTNNNVGIGVSASNSGNMTFDVSNNATITGNRAIGVNVFANASHTGTISGTIQNNTIGTQGVNSSGSKIGSGISASNEGSGVMTVKINSNTVQEVGDSGAPTTGFEGIFVTKTVTAGGTVNATITNNTIRNIYDDRGLQVRMDSASTLNATISGNSFINVAGNGTGSLMRVAGNAGTFKVSQLAPSAATNSAELDDANGLTAAQITVSGTVTFGAAAPAQPLIFVPQAPEVIVSEPAGGSTEGGASEPINGGESVPATTEPPVVIQPPSTPEMPNSADDGVLDQAELDAIVNAAIARWTATGLSAEQIALLHSVTFTISDLPALVLGSASGTTVQLDNNAAGNGWFVDSTPLDDAEFSGTGTRLGATDGPAVTRVDALTTVLHEFGHVLGLDDSYVGTDRDNVMFGFINLGERRLPMAGQADGVAPHVATHEADFAFSPYTIGTLPAGKSITMVFDAKVENPFTNALPQVSAQATVSGSNFTTVVSNDPDTVASGDATVTQIDLPDISVAVSPGAVAEDGSGNLVYTFTRTGDLSAALTVKFNVAGGAAFGTDYTQSGAASFTTTTGTVTFAAGSSTTTVTIDPTADSTVEADESVSLTLSAGTGYEIVSPSAATGTITNDDTDVSVSVSPASVSEDGSGNLVYTFTRTGVTTGSLTVNFSVGGNAAFGTDYTQSGAGAFDAAAGTVTFAPGATTATVIIDPTADNTVEGDETTVLTVTSGTGYNVGSTSVATGVISNDDADVTLSIAPTSVAEDGAGNLVYTFTRTGYTAGALTVGFTVGGTATFNNDYAALGAASFSGTTGTVTFAAGSDTATVTIDPTPDTNAESDETVALTLAGGTGYTATTAGAVTGTIQNDDTIVTVSLATATIAEDASGGLIYTFTRTGDTSTSLLVNFSAGGTATFTSDYTHSGTATFDGTTGTILIPVGQSSASVTLTPVNDTRVEGSETAVFNVATGAGYGVGAAGTGTATGTITDNDTATVSLVSNSSSVGEGSGSHNVGVQLVITANGTVGAGTLERAVSVNLQDLLTGSATAGGSDYTFSTPQTVSFASGEAGSTKNVAVALVNDTRVEGSETINLALNTLSDGSNGQVTLGSTTAHTVTITDNDTATVSLVSNSSSVGEGSGSHNVGVQLVITANGTVGTGTLERAVSVNLADLLTGSATAGGSDYTFSTPQTVSFANGASNSTQNVSVALVNDTRVEGSETINLALNTLSDGSNGQVTLGSTTAHTVTITDNDTATVSLVSNTSSVGEGSGSHNVGVQLVITANGAVGTGTLERAVSVNLADLLTGSATAGGSDYTFSTPQTVSFASGEAGSTKNVSVALVNDTRVEGSETINLALNTLSDGSNGQVTLGSTTAHTVTITDNDTATVSLVSNTSSVSEGSGSHNVGVQLVITANGTVGTGTLERAVSVNLADLLTGSATAGGSDYTFSTPQTVSFANGASSSTQNVSVALVNDTRVEGSETINLQLNTLSDGSNGQVTLGSTTAHTVTITDNDTATVSLVSNTSSVGEGSGSHNVGVQLVITANGTVGTGTLERAVSVNLADLLTGSATAGGSDYTFSTPQTVSFANGASSSTQNVSVALVNDTRVEGSETINLALNTLSDGSNGQVTLGSTTAHTVTITDNDTATVSLVSNSSSVGEEAGTHNVGVQLVITANGTVGAGTLERAVSVNLQDLLTGSATAGGSDYTFSTPQTVSFASGEAGSTKNVAVALVNDTRVEGSETINLALNTLSDGSNGQVTLGSTTAHTVTITDNDTATVSLVSNTSSVGEGSGSHNVGVQLVITANGTVGTGTLERAVSVNLADLLTGSATAGGSDYTFSTPQSVSFANGASSSTQNVSVALVNDTRVEGSETINLALNTLSDGSNGQVTLGSTTAHTVTITDNDTATVSLVSNTSSVGEGSGSHNVGVQLVITANGTVGTGTLERAVSVNLADLLTGSATAGGSDYTFSTPQAVSFASGASSSTQNVSVALVNDTRVEGSETINLQLNTLSDGSNGQVTLGSTTAHTVTITDNDTATVSLVSNSSSVGEEAGTHNVGVQLVITANGTVGTGTLERAVSVNLADLLTGSATAGGSDYTFSTPQTVSFASGASSSTQNVSVALVNDTRVEGSETINLQLNTLSDGSNGQVTLGSTTAHTVTITDNDTATVSLVSNTSSVGEGSGSHNVGVQLVITANGTVGTGTLERAVSVNLADLLTGSATAGGSDYTFSTPQTVSFANGASSSTQNVSVALVNDTRVEGRETINLALNTLSDGSNGQVTLGSTTAHTVTITDNDTATVSLVSGTSSVGEEAGTHNVGVQLVITANGTVGTGTLERAVSVNLADLLTGSATAGGSDYTFSTPQTVSFASGEAGSTKNVAVTLVNDTRVEGSETVNLALNTLSDGSAGLVTLGSTTAHTVTITDNDTATVSLVSNSSSVGEGSGSHNVGVQLVITANGTVGTGTLERAVSVNLADLLTGSATAGGSDYTFSTPQTVSFASGEAGSTKNVAVALVNDTRVEGSETVNLALNTLSDGSAGQVTLGSTTAHTVTITDNDTATISFTAPTSTVGEATAAHDVGVALVITANGTVGTGTIERNVTVNVQDLLNGTATGAGTDYIFSSPQTITFAAGESGGTKTVSLGIVNDSLSEGNESVHLQLNNLVDGTGTQVSLAAPTSHVVTIADNDIDLQVTRTESSDVVVAGSGAGNLTYVITVTNKGLTSATGVVLNENLTLPAGVTVQSVTPSSGNFAVTETPDGNWVLGDLAAGAQATLTVVLTVDSTAAEGIDVISGAAHVTAANQDIVDTTDDSATESTSVDRQVDLHITKDDGVTTITPGGALAYGINIKNVGPSDATGVVITEILPAGTTFNAGASTAGWTETAPGSGIFTLNLGTVVGHGFASPVTFAVNVANPAAAGQHEVVNTATIADDGTAGADLTTGDNRAEDRNILDAAPQFSLSITDNISNTVARGGLVYYTLTYSNVGTQDATGVFLTEHVPLHATFVAGESDANWVLQSDGSYRLDIGNLASGAAPQSVVFAVHVDSSIPAGVRELVNNGSIDDDGVNAVTDLNTTDAERTLIYQGIYAVSPGITLPKQGPASNIRVFDVATGSEFSFVAYEPTYRDSVRIAVGDMNGDGFDDIITATRTGTGRVRVFDGVTGEQFSGVFAEINPFNGRAQKGAYVAAGDVTGDGHDDIIVGSALGGGMVKVYDGVTGSLLTSYEAFGKSYHGGVRLAVGDVDGDDVEEIVAGQGNFGNKVKVFSGVSSTALQNIQVGGKNYRGGIDVAAGDVNSDGKADIITGRNSKSAPWVEIFNGADSAPLGRFLAFESGFRNGIRVATADVNVDGIADIIVGAGYKGDSRVRIFDGSSAAAYEELSHFVAFPDYPDVSLFVAGTSPVPIVASRPQQPV